MIAEMVELEVYTRPAGRAGVGPCPGCGDLIVMCVYEPVLPRQHVPKRKRAFDYPPSPPGDEYANHASLPGLSRAWLITPDRPFIDGDKRLVPHLATHPQCTPYLTRTQS